jgi:hypothetical protein
MWRPVPQTVFPAGRRVLSRAGVWLARVLLLSFMAICGLGAVVDVLVARDLYAMTQMWLLAGASEPQSVRSWTMR